jgi:hypothetical protein
MRGEERRQLSTLIVVTLEQQGGGCLRKTRYRGRERVQMSAYLVAASYNLSRIARLAAAPV